MNEPKQSDLEIFNDTLALPEPQRAAYLLEVCAKDAPLREKIESLLAVSNDDSGGFDHFSLKPSQPCSMPGPVGETRESIGRYKLLKKIGEGGCGVVYVADQQEPVKRRVALKVIKAGMDTKSVIARFGAERQALAMMDHPNIAKVFDAGSTENGRPYFVMELVWGKRITEFCKENNLSVPSRLELYIQVCQAVQHAHQKGIIHRDLKPSNILVSQIDGVSIPKIIDFGIAKAMSGRLTENTVFTAVEQFIGTPAYMSPEQALITSEDIDTRSDIYSLGVLLYELLTGKPPFDNHELLTAGLDEMRRIIREVEPPRPSRLSLATHQLSLPSDLDWIVMKCLEKDRSRRYESASALALDLQRHLNSEPVLARPLTAAYRFQKLVRRHRTVSMAVTLVTLAVVLAAIISTLSLLRERAGRERERAARVQADHRLVSALRFVDDIFNGVAPEIRRVPGAVKAQEKLGEASLRMLQQLRSGAAEDPRLREALANSLVYLSRQQGNLGEGSTTGNYEMSAQLAREAVELFSGVSPTNLSAKQVQLLIDAKHALASSLPPLGRYEEAIAVLEQTLPLLDILESHPGFKEDARTRRAGYSGNAGYYLILAGRPQAGLERYLRKLSVSEWARTITTNSNAWDLEVLATTYGQLTVAHERLNQFALMTEAAEKGIYFQEILLQRSPQNTRHLGCMAAFRSVHGHGLMHAGRTNEAVLALDQSRSEIEALVAKDEANEFARSWRANITATQARAFALWSEQSSRKTECEDHLRLARRFLAEAEGFTAALKSKLGGIDIDLHKVRGEINRAQENLDSDSQENLEHPPPTAPLQ